MKVPDTFIPTFIPRHLHPTLIVGWMMSAIGLQIKNGGPFPQRARKYEHPIYAAWRTFSNAVEQGGYNPFEAGFDLKGYGPISELHQYIDGVFDEWFKLQTKRDGYNYDTYESNAFIAEKLPEMQKRTKAVYDQIATDVRQQIVLL